MSEVPENLGPPFILKPENEDKGLPATTDMLTSDLVLQPKIPFSPAEPVDFLPPQEQQVCTADNPAGHMVNETATYASNRSTNITVPEPPESKEESSVDYSLSGPSIGTEDGGVGAEYKRGVRQYMSSGYTRRNPDGTYEVDNDFGGKWSDEFTIVEGSAETEFFDVSVAEGSFGEEGDAFTGSGSVLGADSGASANFDISNKGLTADAGANINGSMAEGSISSTDEHAVSGSASGSAVSGSAEAQVEAVFTAEQATLGGKLGAEVNLLEGQISGELNITPKRVVDPLISLYNWATDDDVEPLDEVWDIGIMVGGEVSGQLGAQAGLEGRAGYEKGKLRAEAGAKLGLGLGAGVKAKGGIVGADKIMNGLSSAWDWATDW